VTNDNKMVVEENGGGCSPDREAGGTHGLTFAQERSTEDSETRHGSDVDRKSGLVRWLGLGTRKTKKGDNEKMSRPIVDVHAALAGQGTWYTACARNL